MDIPEKKKNNIILKQQNEFTLYVYCDDFIVLLVDWTLNADKILNSMIPSVGWLTVPFKTARKAENVNFKSYQFLFH